MGRQRSPDREKAEKLYIESKGKIKLKRIADILKLPEGTIRGWKNKDSWEEKINGTFLKKNKRNTERSIKKNNSKKPIADEVEDVLENTELTDKQRLFCMYYVKYRNKTKAYMKAYQCSYENAHSHAYELWQNVAVKNEIDRQLKELRDELKVDVQDITQKYIDIAFADISDYVKFGQKEMPFLNPITGEQATDDEGNDVTYTANYVDFKESSEVDGTIISEVSKGKDGIKVKLQDKMKALQWLAEHMGLLTTETQIKLQNEKTKIKIAKEKLALDSQTDGKGAGGNIDQLTEVIKQSADTYKKSGEH